MEHRLGSRMRVRLPARLDAQGGTSAFGLLRNVSLSGAYLKVSGPFKPLMRVDVGFDCGCFADTEVIRVAAFVTRTDADGVAVEWCEFAPDAVARLMAFAGSPPGRRVELRLPREAQAAGAARSHEKDSQAVAGGASR